MRKSEDNIPDLGQRFLDKLFGKMLIDQEWSLREPNRIQWWPHRLRQSIWVDPPFDDEGMTIWRAHSRTDLVGGFGGGVDEESRLMEDAMYSTLSGLVRSPDDPSRVQLAASLYFHEETFDWAWETMSWIAGLQAIEAHRDADSIAERHPDWMVDTTDHPTTGPRKEPDDLLSLGQLAFIHGMTESRYAGTEMLRAKSLLDGPPSLLTTGDETYIGAEFPFPRQSMFLQASCRDQNPNLGNGLLTLLKLPGNPAGRLPKSCLECNERELNSLTRSHFVGSWCDAKGVRTHVSFLPNALFSPATTERMIMSALMRAAWIANDVLDYSWTEHYGPDAAKKLQSIRALSDAAGSRPGLLARLFGRRR